MIGSRRRAAAVMTRAFRDAAKHGEKGLLMPVVTVLGGCGIFGGRIAEALARDADCRVRVAGRDETAGGNFAHRIGAEFRSCAADDRDSLRRAIEGSRVVVHAAGPFQGADYRVAEVCLEQGAHYLDLADAREFVAGIGTLHDAAAARGLLLVSGVSSTPGITGALVERMRPEFAEIDLIQTALSPGNQNPRGAATVGAVLSYLNRKIRVWEEGAWVNRPGWGDSRRFEFPAPVGRRRVYNCDVPELELFPEHFGARTVRFYAGLELDALNFLLSVCGSFAELFGFDLTRRRRLFLNLSLMLYPFGSKNGSLAVWVRGKDHAGLPRERRLAIVTSYDGPATPSSAAIVLARKILAAGPPRVGAFPCLGFFTAEEIFAHLRPLGVWWFSGDESGWGERTADG